MFRRIFAILCTSVMLFTLTSCKSFDFNVDGLLSPPKQEGYIYPIQKALEKAVGSDITLKYPVSGDYRSAFTLVDLDGDRVEEALALYSTNVDNAVTMHLNIIDLENEDWVSKTDISIVGSGIEKLTFCDLNDDRVPEIIVGWMVYGTVDKQVGVYTYDGNSLSQRALEKYTDFLCGKIRAKANNELILIHHNSTEKTSTVRTLTFTDKGIEETGSAMLDGGITSYNTPIVSSLKDGRPALYIDAIKGTGSLTEVVWFDSDVLKTLYDPHLFETKLTYRPSLVFCKDFDNDSIVDIPIMRILKSTEQKSDVDKVYITSWCSFDGEGLKLTQNTIINYTDGYYITPPDSWLENIYLARKTDSRMRIFYSYDSETDTQGDEVFRIVAATKSDFESEKYDNSYQKLDEYSGIVYLVKITEQNSLGIGFEELKSNFQIIK